MNKSYSFRSDVDKRQDARIALAKRVNASLAKIYKERSSDGASSGNSVNS